MKLSEIEGFDHLFAEDRKHLKTLIRRLEYVERLVVARGGSYNKAEAAALKFALQYIKEARGYRYEKINSSRRVV